MACGTLADSSRRVGVQQPEESKRGRSGLREIPEPVRERPLFRSDEEPGGVAERALLAWLQRSRYTHYSKRGTAGPNHRQAYARVWNRLPGNHLRLAIFAHRRNIAASQGRIGGT